MKTVKKIASACFLLLVISGLSAQNISFLQRTPIAYMNDADQDMLRPAFADALNEQPDGAVVEWRNPDTEHGGTITVVDTHEDFDTTCRTVRVFAKAGGREGSGVYRLCKDQDDRWRFAPVRRATN